jgi:hypothetical protein
MKIIKRLCNRQWVSVVLYEVYLHLFFTETVIEHDKRILNKIFRLNVGQRNAPRFERVAEFEIIDTVNCIGCVTDIS